MKTTEIKKMILIRAIEKEISLAEIGREVGVTRGAVYRVARNINKTPRLRRLICQRLGFKPAELGWPDDFFVTRKKHARRKKR